jgi:hypothetical protein
MIIIGMGINKTISISNTMKMIANRKNRRENGMRAVWFGSNPHSNGDNFSRSEEVFIDNIIVIITIMAGTINVSIEASNI